MVRYMGRRNQQPTHCNRAAYLPDVYLRFLNEKDMESEVMEALTGETLSKVFPLYEEGQSMRWSKFKIKDPREYLIS